MFVCLLFCVSFQYVYLCCCCVFLGGNSLLLFFLFMLVFFLLLFVWIKFTWLRSADYFVLWFSFYALTHFIWQNKIPKKKETKIYRHYSQCTIHDNRKTKASTMQREAKRKESNGSSYINESSVLNTVIKLQRQMISLK